MCDSRSFSHNQSLCHELVPEVFRPHFLTNERGRPIRNGEHCRPRERLLQPVICLFFAGHELKPDCWSSCHELGHDGYQVPVRGGLRPHAVDMGGVGSSLCVSSEVCRKTCERSILSGDRIVRANHVVQYQDMFIWCFADKWSMHVCANKHAHPTTASIDPCCRETNYITR